MSSHISAPILWNKALMLSYGEDDYGLYMTIFPAGRVVMKKENWGDSYIQTRQKLFNLPNETVMEIEYATWNGWRDDEFFCDLRLLDIKKEEFYRGWDISEVKSWENSNGEITLNLKDMTSLKFNWANGGPSAVEIVNRLKNYVGEFFIELKPKKFRHPSTPLFYENEFTDIEVIANDSLLKKSKAAPWIFSSGIRSSTNGFNKKFLTHTRRFEIEIPYKWKTNNDLYHNIRYVIFYDCRLDSIVPHLTGYSLHVYRHIDDDRVHHTHSPSSGIEETIERCDNNLSKVLRYFQSQYGGCVK